MGEDEERGFKVKVTDKRRFTAKGEVRADARDDEPESAAPPPEPPARPQQTQPQPEKSEQPPKDASGRQPMEFLTFVASLATNALAAFGMLPPEQAQGLPVNPELGREYIEILSMLQEKTRGNLTPQEEASLQRIVTDLRMAYVEASKRAGKS